MPDHDLSAIYVVVPDRFGALVVAIGDLVDRLTDDDESLDDALGNAAIDSLDKRHPVEHLARIRQLNETGDATAYWNPA